MERDLAAGRVAGQTPGGADNAVMEQVRWHPGREASQAVRRIAHQDGDHQGAEHREQDRQSLRSPLSHHRILPQSGRRRRRKNAVPAASGTRERRRHQNAGARKIFLLSMPRKRPSFSRSVPKVARLRRYASSRLKLASRKRRAQRRV